MPRDETKDPALTTQAPTPIDAATAKASSSAMSLARLRGVEALVMGAQGADPKALGLVMKLCALVESDLTGSPQRSPAMLKINTIYGLAPTLFSDAADKEREHSRVGILAATASLRNMLK